MFTRPVELPKITTDFSKMPLGKHVPKKDSRDLMFAKYLISDKLPPIPSWVNYEEGITDWGMMLNANLGCCSIATAGHMLMMWTAANKNLIIPPDSAIMKAYSDVSGYNPNTGSNDNGCAELDVLNYLKNTGLDGHKILGFAQLTPGNTDHLKIASWLFGGTRIGLQLPISAQTQDYWDVPSYGAVNNGAPGSWGGHSTPIVGWNKNFIKVVTWGQIQKMSWAFFNTYCDEASACLSGDFAKLNAKAPNGVNWSLLEKDLNLV